MAKKKVDKFAIPFPVLYDTKVYQSSNIKSFLFNKRIEKLMRSEKGYFNYDTNKFEIPKKDFDIIEKNPKMEFTLNIIKEVGFKII